MLRFWEFGAFDIYNEAKNMYNCKRIIMHDMYIMIKICKKKE